MLKRLCNQLKSNSFFIFGARGTGKSTLVQELLNSSVGLTIDLLTPDDEERYQKSPHSLISEVRARASQIEWVLIDEVQRIPKLLDVVHVLMETSETRHIKFALTGSSARRLKLLGANLLAGRAFMNSLHPLTHIELGEVFDLDQALNWGTLPKIFSLKEDVARQEFLRTYSRIYLKEEVWDERLVHNLDPFRKFIEVAAVANGTILNFSKIGREAGVDDKTAKKYFEILADTFLGFYLEAFHRSVRKQQILAPKFYLFDPGVKRAMEGLLTVPIVPSTYAYGKAFEHFLICECIRVNEYLRLDYRFSYLRTKDDLEIDLIIERPGRAPVLVEIKSADIVHESDASTLKRFLKDFPTGEFYLWSKDSRPKMFEHVRAVHWQEGMREIGLVPLA